MEFKHRSVLFEETINGLNIRPDGTYCDGTLGGAGHASEVVRRLNGTGHFIGVDQDMDAITVATGRLEAAAEEAGQDGKKTKLTVLHENYEQLPDSIEEMGIDGVDGIVLDLGVSSYQLDNAERGFTYREDVPLDMRMDQTKEKTARDIVNEYSEYDLYRIIRDYGEDSFAKNIAKHIVKHRENDPIETTGQLVEIIKEAIPMKVRAKGGHPAKKTFQALRIELNGELAVLENSIDRMIDCLTPGGRLCIITFHSLEDRIVKNKFRENENPCTCPPSFPVCVCGRKSKGKVITRKPILPSEQELQENSRSQSAKLRIFEKA